MWVVALVGGASAFIESALAQVYKKRDADGSSYGGPSYYMEQALHQRWLDKNNATRTRCSGGQ